MSVGPPVQCDKAAPEDVARAFCISTKDLKTCSDIEKADWVAILEKILEKPEVWDDIHLVSVRIRTRCDASKYTLQQIKEGKHSTLGAWVMNFCGQMCGRLQN